MNHLPMNHGMTTSMKASAEAAVKASIRSVKRWWGATRGAAMERRDRMRNVANSIAMEARVPGNYSRSA